MSIKDYMNKVSEYVTGLTYNLFPNPIYVARRTNGKEEQISNLENTIMFMSRKGDGKGRSRQHRRQKLKIGKTEIDLEHKPKKESVIQYIMRVAKVSKTVARKALSNRRHK